MARFIFLCCLIAFIAFQESCFSTLTVKRSVENTLRVGSFNVQTLGNKKLSNETVMGVVRKIILSYDIILVQEIVTKEQHRLVELLQSINSLSRPRGVYDMKLSTRLGRGKAKEQYGYFFRTDKVSALSDQVYPDRKDDFMRPPYIVHFSTPTVDGLSSFVMIGIHTQPMNAVNEINSLVDVYKFSKDKYGMQDILILGDLNAGCASVRRRDWSDISLREDSRFQWLIGDDVSTTTNSNSCPYDRIVAVGENLKRAIVPNSARVFNFRAEYRLTQKQATSVSDHYPVDVQLKGKL